MDLQKIEREKRLQRREERRERALALHKGMSTRATNQEINPLELGHHRQEEGMEKEVSPTKEDMWIEKQEALQLEAPQEGTTLSPLNPRTRIQAIVEEDL